MVVLGSDESATLGSHGRPRIFDWVVLREVERYVDSTSNPPRTLARLVMSDQAVETKFDDNNFGLFSKLAQRGGFWKSSASGERNIPAAVIGSLSLKLQMP